MFYNIYSGIVPKDNESIIKLIRSMLLIVPLSLLIVIALLAVHSFIIGIISLPSCVEVISIISVACVAYFGVYLYLVAM